MIFPQTRLLVADNTGARIVQCIGMPGHKKVAQIGRVITVTIKSMAKGTGGSSAGAAGPSVSGARIKAGEVHKALVVRTVKPSSGCAGRRDGRLVRFDDNAAVLLTPEYHPLGTRIYGPVGHELRTSGHWAKILSLATRVL